MFAQTVAYPSILKNPIVLGVVVKMPKKSEPPEAPETVEEVPEPQEPELPFDLTTVDPKTLDQADAILKPAGMSIRRLAGWANSVELRLQGIVENLEPVVQNAVEGSLRKLQAQATKQQQAYLQQNPQMAGGMGGQGGINQLLPLLMQGGGQDEEMVTLQKDMFKLMLDRMRGDMDFTRSIKDAIVTKIAGKAAGDLIP